MLRILKIGAGLFVLGCVGAVGGYWYFITQDMREPSMLTFRDNCAECHGPDSDLLVSNTEFESVAKLTADIKRQHATIIDEAEISQPMVKALAIYIIEQRTELPSITESHIPNIPKEVVNSQYHDFSVEVVTEVGKGLLNRAPARWTNFAGRESSWPHRH